MSVRTEECNEQFVDIHGRDIPAVIVERTGEVAFPLSELQQTGVAIYQKSQFAKLSTMEKRFDAAFYDYMLESAKNYLLLNKISFFTDDQILTSINNCKRLLTENKKSAPSPGVFKNRVIAEKSDHEICIQVSNKPPVSRSPQPPRFSPPIPKVDIKKHKSPNFDTRKLFDGVADKPKEKTSAQETKNGEKINMKKEGDSSGYKLRQPRAKALEKLAFNKENPVEHDVIVTFCEKRNCIWVQDKANHDILETIFRKVNEEAKYQKMVAKPWQFEKVYLAQDEGLWFRCKVMRISPLTVFFLDYGNMAEVEGLKEVSEELAKIPCMAVRLTFREHEYIPCLEDELKIRIMKQNDDGTYFVTVLKQSKSTSAPKFPNGVTSERKPKPPHKFTKIPPPLCTLENGQVVVIIHEEMGNFYLRTKQCFEKMRDIENECSEYAKVTPSSESYDVNQIVLVRDDERYCRAVIKKINNNTQVDVEFLDYFKMATVDLNLVKNISESLSRFPVTYFPAGRKLKGYANLEFTEEAKNLISESITNRKKYIVVLNTDGSFDLQFDGSHKLSELIQELEDKDDKIRLRDIKRFEPEIGVKRYLCSCYKESGDLILVQVDQLRQYKDSVIMQQFKDSTPYTPIMGEVCLCFHDETWYRCLVTRTLFKDYEVLLLDFGNVEVIKESNFRKPSKGITDIPALALPCRLIDLPDHPQVNDLLKKLIIEGEFYNFEVKSMTNKKWNVKIPAVYQKIENTPVEDF